LLLFRDSIYPAHFMDTTKPYLGIPELLRYLTAFEYPMGVCSNKPEPLTRQLVEKIFPDISFVYVAGQKEGVPRKPDPASALEVARNIGIPPQEILYVGDSGVDMQTALNAGMTPMGVTWGYRSVQVLEQSGAVAIANTMAEILGFLGSGYAAKTDNNNL